MLFHNAHLQSEPTPHISRKLLGRNPDLLHTVAVAHRYRVIFFNRVKIYSHAIRRANFVLTAIAFSDIAVVVISNALELPLEFAKYLLGLFNKFWLIAQQRRHGDQHG